MNTILVLQQIQYWYSQDTILVLPTIQYLYTHGYNTGTPTDTILVLNPRQHNGTPTKAMELFDILSNLKYQYNS